MRPDLPGERKHVLVGALSRDPRQERLPGRRAGIASLEGNERAEPHRGARRNRDDVSGGAPPAARPAHGVPARAPLAPHGAAPRHVFGSSFNAAELMQ